MFFSILSWDYVEGGILHFAAGEHWSSVPMVFLFYLIVVYIVCARARYGT